MLIRKLSSIVNYQIYALIREAQSWQLQYFLYIRIPSTYTSLVFYQLALLDYKG